MAITHSLPFRQWYTDATSQWTLDYPPLFAVFEYFLSHFAALVEPEMLQIRSEPYMSPKVLLFQRITVIFSELVLLVGVLSIFPRNRPCGNSARELQHHSHDGAVNYHNSIAPTEPKDSENIEEIVYRRIPGEEGEESRLEHEERLKECRALGVTCVMLDAGLVIVDHIHFQYNGFLIGILLLSLTNIAKGRVYVGAIFFTCLLYLKHIFLYVSPAVGLFLIRFYCWQPRLSGNGTHIDTTQPSSPGGVVTTETSLHRESHRQPDSTRRHRWYGSGLKHIWEVVPGGALCCRRLIALGLVVSSISVLCLAPIVATGNLANLVSRLFPFHRGLTHAYWAPNLWALYLFCDRILRKGLSIMSNLGIVVDGIQATAETRVSPTSGLVTLTSTAVLADITPSTCTVLTALLYMPVLAVVWTLASVAQREKDTSSRQALGALKPRQALGAPPHGNEYASGGAVYVGPFLISLVAMGSAVSFFCGWHVHEKAILYSTIPLGACLWGSRNPELIRTFFWLKTISNFSLLPLLHQQTAVVLLLKYGGFISGTAVSALCAQYCISTMLTTKPDIACGDTRGRTSSGRRQNADAVAKACTGSEADTDARCIHWQRRHCATGLLGRCLEVAVELERHEIADTARSGFACIFSRYWHLLFCSRYLFLQLLILTWYEASGHQTVFGNLYPFSALMLTSAFCSVGMLVLFVSLFNQLRILINEDTNKNSKVPSPQSKRLSETL
eukprot:GHVQ01012522.1.p1 GENE.GHVQ01012522.1~~GHVQ01012522.1.p1  ORF type:complete len:729 (-),score=42.81 GHVQ01012522.1:996-3182(-)